MDWWIHRILTSKRYNETKREVEEHWSLEEVLAAHLTLDMLEELDVKAAKAANKK